MKIMQPFFII